MCAAKAGKRLLLANKEALVVGGAVFMQAVAEGGAKLLPIDSEHSAIFQSLPDDTSTWAARVDKLILTASGGPFRQRDPATFCDVLPAQACAHPNWVMGRKISIVAQLGTTDMRVPIAYGLCWPDRMASGADALDFHALAAMTFESVDDHGHQARFPGLKLAWQVLDAAEGVPAVLNAANEIAVDAFLAGRIRFDQIHAVNAHTLDTTDVPGADSLDALLEIDRMARVQATRHVASLAR